MSHRGFWRRRQFLVNRNFQFRYIALLMLQMSAVLASIGLLVYGHVTRTVNVALKMPFVQGVSNAPLVADMADSLHGFYGRSILLLAVTSVILMVFGLLGSHRLAGPMVKLEAHLNRLADGDFSQRITFRRNDFLDEFADGINRTVDSIVERRRRADELRQQIAEKWNPRFAETGDRRQAIAEMQHLLAELRQVV